MCATTAILSLNEYPRWSDAQTVVKWRYGRQIYMRQMHSVSAYLKTYGMPLRVTNDFYMIQTKARLTHDGSRAFIILLHEVWRQLAADRTKYGRSFQKLRMRQSSRQPMRPNGAICFSWRAPPFPGNHPEQMGIKSDPAAATPPAAPHRASIDRSPPNSRQVLIITN